MIILPLLDLLFLGISIFCAVYNRGTVAGWMCTFLVFWQIWMLIKFVKEHP
jgi:hypothetical protein